MQTVGLWEFELKSFDKLTLLLSQPEITSKRLC